VDLISRSSEEELRSLSLEEENVGETKIVDLGGKSYLSE